MPKRRNAVKKIRVDRTRHIHNLKIKKELKKTIKAFLASVTAKNIEEGKIDSLKK